MFHKIIKEIINLRGGNNGKSSPNEKEREIEEWWCVEMPYPETKKKIPHSGVF